ncbi:hypothetical protein QR680_013898 [Steinernema hermaphroditum]|uniref:G-protein coupled receptors family 1 profile domain-containing protein n=1 Tax=Steinernema hermaphroditum TaxID=289476 RepID=A0AA39I722_9BILA|nr:hypothetical protein QR680_013898 [Steinernema hermaphroditum]
MQFHVLPDHMDVAGYVSTFGFMAQGILLIFFNLPVLIFATISTKQRLYYGVLIMSLLNGLIIGIVSIGYSVFRLIINSQGRSSDTVLVHMCFYNPITFLLLWTFPMNGLSLLMIAVDRFMVVAYPLLYFRSSKTIVILINIAALIINASLMAFTIIYTLMENARYQQVNILCNQNQFLSLTLYVIVAGCRTLFSVLFITVMLIVLLCLRWQHHLKVKQAFQTEVEMQKFAKRQMEFTKTMLFSCAATLFLFILPSTFAIIAQIYALDTKGDIATWTRLVTFFNSFNIAILVLYRQRDIRRRMFFAVKRVTFGKILHLKASVIPSTTG